MSSPPQPWRVLLDQGFPVPPGFDPTDLDRMIEYTALYDFDRKLAQISTPDWMVILAAAKAGFDAFVVDDQDIRSEMIDLVALASTELSLITWSVGIDDQVTAWAQLLAYMPKIHQKTLELGPSIFILPAVRLTRGEHIVKAATVAAERASKAGTTYAAVRSEAKKEMSDQLKRRGRSDLSDLL